VKKGTMITMIPITTNLTNSILLKGGIVQKGSKPFPRLEEGALAPVLQTIVD
jgi:hypothetical protein